MDLVFSAEHGLLTAAGFPVAESDTQQAHTGANLSVSMGVFPVGWLMECTTGFGFGWRRTDSNVSRSRLVERDFRICSLDGLSRLGHCGRNQWINGSERRPAALAEERASGR
jgi:hypothetical protein